MKLNFILIESASARHMLEMHISETLGVFLMVRKMLRYLEA